MFTHELPVGSKPTWAKPLAGPAVIEPVWCVVWSLMTTWKPLGVSCIVTTSLSPEPMNRSLLASGVKVAPVAVTGLAGAWATPLLVMKAKLTYSSPPTMLFRQVALLTALVFMLVDRLSIFSAAHHWVGSQLLPGGHSTQPGG